MNREAYNEKSIYNCIECGALYLSSNESSAGGLCPECRGLKEAKGAWAGDDWKATRRRRRKIELKASKRRKQE